MIHTFDANNVPFNIFLRKNSCLLLPLKLKNFPYVKSSTCIFVRSNYVWLLFANFLLFFFSSEARNKYLWVFFLRKIISRLTSRKSQNINMETFLRNKSYSNRFFTIQLSWNSLSVLTVMLYCPIQTFNFNWSSITWLQLQAQFMLDMLMSNHLCAPGTWKTEIM